MKMTIAAWAAAGAALAALLGLAAVQEARSQVNAAPSLIPIGVAASGSTSTVWFHEPSSRQAVACQTVGTAATGPSGIQCVATRLP